MNKKVIFTIVGIVLIVSVAVVYVLVSPPKQDPVSEVKVVNEVASQEAESKSTDTEEPAAPAETMQPQATETVVSTEPGQYKDYSEGVIDKTAGTKLLFFHASWCPQCRALEASIKSDGVPSGVTIFKIDYDSNQGLRQKYGVTIQTTIVKVDDAGNKVASYVAYDEPTIGSVERELLN